MMNLIQIVRDHWVHVLVPMGFLIGCYLDRKNDEKANCLPEQEFVI